MQITIPSPPKTEYTFTTTEIKANTSIGEILIRDFGNGELGFWLFVKDNPDRLVFIPAAGTNAITITTEKKFKRR